VKNFLKPTKQKVLLALVFYPVCYFISLVIHASNTRYPLYCWPSPDPLPYMTPGSNLFHEWQAAESVCGASSQLRLIFWNIQDYLWIILPFAASYFIVCAIMTLRAKKRRQKKGRMSDYLFIILVFTVIDLFVLIGLQAFPGIMWP
jgi:hypothetical protein